MHHNRISQTMEWYRLPQPPAPVPTPAGFMFCPLALLQGLTLAQHAMQMAIYQVALQQAQAVARPSILERDLLAVWN